MKNILLAPYHLFIFFLFVFYSCKQSTKTPSAEAINSINLKKGTLVLCGPSEKELGIVSFQVSGNKETIKDFNFAVALLHSFEYEESEKVFAQIIEKDP